jgi:hypothetical protein
MKKIFAFGIIAVVLFASCSNAVSPSGSGSSGSGTGTNTGTGTGTTVTLPAYALGETFTVNGGLLKNYSKNISDVTTVTGTVWDYSGKKQYGTVKNGVLTLVSPTLTSSDLFSFSLYSKDLTISPATAKFFHMQGCYLKKDGDTETKYYVSSDSATKDIILQQYIYSDSDAKVSGSYVSSSGSTKFTYDLDLKKGWNGIEMTVIPGTPQEQIYKTAKTTTFTWGLDDR